jgi:DNA-binding transcriptional MerR regulator/methylmalonyl-CoA mutase cobalamin-binding subunit
VIARGKRIVAEVKNKNSSASAGHDLLPLATVARLTGLSPDVIRVWERRYGVVHPIRGPRGARLYQVADVERLHLLAAAVSAGRSIGDVAHLELSELKALVTTEVPTLAVATVPQPLGRVNGQGSINAELLAAVERYDERRVEELLGDALIALGVRPLIDRVLVPLLHEVGERWLRGTFTVAHEHFLSAILRNLLAQLLRVRRSYADVPQCLLATPQGEPHEFGILLVALVLADIGVGMRYLGTNVPAPELVEAARTLGVRVVGLSFVHSANRSRAVAYLRTVAKTLPPHVDVWAGGQEAPTVVELSGCQRCVVFSSLHAVADRAQSLSALRSFRKH